MGVLGDFHFLLPNIFQNFGPKSEKSPNHLQFRPLIMIVEKPPFQYSITQPSNPLLLYRTEHTLNLILCFSEFSMQFQHWPPGHLSDHHRVQQQGWECTGKLCCRYERNHLVQSFGQCFSGARTVTSWLRQLTVPQTENHYSMHCMTCV